MEKLSFKHKFWIEDQDGESIFGDGKYKLFKAIDETGSLKKAVEKMNLSYRKTWNKLKDIEDKLGFPVIETTQGGVSGGSTSLTEKGKILIAAFELIHTLCDPHFIIMKEKVTQKLS